MLHLSGSHSREVQMPHSRLCTICKSCATDGAQHAEESEFDQAEAHLYL